jgi:hypothetical protein
VDNWKELPNDRKIWKTKYYSVIVPVAKRAVVPLDCPVCELLMRDHDDVLSFRRNICCLECELVWAIPNTTSWKKGWRPSPGDVISELNKRNDVPSFIYQVK